MKPLISRADQAGSEPQQNPSSSSADKLHLALQYAVLAPSSHNSQPWRFLVDNNAITLCADRTRALPVVDPFDRELIISCGAALFNLRVALNHFDLAHTIHVFPSSSEPDVVADIHIVSNGYLDKNLLPLFAAIPERVTTREPFIDEPVSDDIQRQLIEAGEAEGVEVVCIDGVDERAQIAELIAAADQLQFADPRFRRELASWIDSRHHDDGMPAYAAGITTLLDFAKPLATLALRTFNLGGGMAASHHRLVDGSPLLVGLLTDSDNPEAWLATGQALERLLLAAVNAGLTASYLNQPVETEVLRPRLRALMRSEKNPQLLLRIGRGPTIAHAPRRALPSVVS